MKPKILFITDNLLASSGVAHISQLLVWGTADKFDWVCIAGGQGGNRPQNIVTDISDKVKSETGKAASVKLVQPAGGGYGNEVLILRLIDDEKPNAVLIMSDPRYYSDWFFQFAHRIRREIPILYLNVWDNAPAPMWNWPFYSSCDTLLCISKLTKWANESVLGKEVCIDFL